MSLPFIVQIVIQIAFCFHAVRSGRNQWMFIILFLPFIGWLAYLVIEILPGYFTGPGAQAVRGRFAKALNPYKALKEAKMAFEIAPTVANRISYARRLLARGSNDEAIGVLKPALTNFFAGDPAILEGLASAYFAKKEYPQALIYVEQIVANEDWPVKASTNLMRARIYEEEGQMEAAQDLFQRLAQTAPGEEAKVAYGQFLTRQKQPAEAKAVYADIVKRSGYMSPHARKMEGAWIRLAQREMARLPS